MASAISETLQNVWKRSLRIFKVQPSKSAMTRMASANDIEAILPLLRELHKESSFSVVPIDDTKLRNFMMKCIQRSDWVCIVHGSTSIDGLMIGYIEEYFFSKEKGAWDLVVYVRPERRGGLTAYRLISEFREWARKSGAGFLWLGTAAGIDSSRVRKFYLGLGAREMGGIFRLELS